MIQVFVSPHDISPRDPGRAEYDRKVTNNGSDNSNGKTWINWLYHFHPAVHQNGNFRHDKAFKAPLFHSLYCFSLGWVCVWVGG